MQVSCTQYPLHTRVCIYIRLHPIDPLYDYGEINFVMNFPCYFVMRYISLVLF